MTANAIILHYESDKITQIPIIWICMWAFVNTFNHKEPSYIDPWIFSPNGDQSYYDCGDLNGAKLYHLGRNTYSAILPPWAHFDSMG